MIETHLNQSRQIVKLGLIKVVRDLFPEETLKTDYSIGDGVFCELSGSALSEREVRQIGARLREWVDNGGLVRFLHKKDGYYQYKVDNLIIKTIYPAAEKISEVGHFRIIPFAPGFIVDFTIPGEKKKGETLFALPKKLSATYWKSRTWLKNIDLEHVEDINSYITSGRKLELLSIAEALQEKEISDIADMIIQQRRAVRILLISGPSSSGKTTFTKRLSTQLRVNGLKPVPLSLDDYYVNRDQTPLDEYGNYDFEALEALDLPLLRKQIKSLIRGETVETPIYDFVTGTRSSKTNTLSIGTDEVLVVEGIHAFNPSLLDVSSRGMLFKIYISALFGLNVDLINRIPTTEVRIIRRMVRDDRFRGFSPERTFEQWDSVRRGEVKYIFKFQEDADVMFNSSLVYEMNALRPFAEESLKKIPDDSPFYPTKERILNLLSFFEPIDHSKIPFNSILREFIGGSIYYNKEENSI